MERPLGAQISHMLKDREVEVIFGIPGVHNQEMYRGIEEAGLTHVLARHEQGAGFMADGYARATGRPGVCYVITGPGLTNIMTPMGQAYSDSVPMLVISSCLDETAATRGQLHQMKDQEGAARCVADWSETARTPDAAYTLIDRALTEFRHGRRRPKHIQVPISVLQAPAPPFPKPQPMGLLATQRPSHLMLEPILTAKRPLFIFGGGATGCAYAARDVLKKMNAAAFDTYAGRGVSTPSGLSFGAYLARPGARDVIASADVVVLVGTELSETDTWREDAGIRGLCIEVNIDASGFNPTAERYIHAPAGEVMDLLLEQLEDFEPVATWDKAEIRAAKRRWQAEVDAERPGILPVVKALRAALGEITVIYSDMTQFAYAATEIWPMKHPGFWHHPTGFGTLGYALPAAIGGKIGRLGVSRLGRGKQDPLNPVIAIAGDYGFQYTLQELAVAVELELCLPIILWDNGKLGEIEDSMVRAQIAPNAVVQKNPDFVKLAEAYGAAAARPDTLAELQEVVRAALIRPRPTLIHVTSDIA